MDEQIVENIFKNYENKKKLKIQEIKSKVETDQTFFLQDIYKASNLLREIISMMYSLTFRLNLMGRMTQKSSRKTLADNIDLSMKEWIYIQKRVNFAISLIQVPCKVIFYSEERNFVDPYTIGIIFASTDDKLKVVQTNAPVDYDSDEELVNEINGSGSGSGFQKTLPVIFEDKYKNNYQLENDTLTIENGTQLLFPKNYVFIEDDVIFLIHRRSFFYRDQQQANVGKHYPGVQSKLLRDWALLCSLVLTNETLERAFAKTLEISDEIQRLLESY